MSMTQLLYSVEETTVDSETTIESTTIIQSTTSISSQFEASALIANVEFTRSDSTTYEVYEESLEITTYMSDMSFIYSENKVMTTHLEQFATAFQSICESKVTTEGEKKSNFSLSSSI